MRVNGVSKESNRSWTHSRECNKSKELQMLFGEKKREKEKKPLMQGQYRWK